MKQPSEVNGNGTRKVRFTLYCITVGLIIIGAFAGVIVAWTQVRGDVQANSERIADKAVIEKNFELRDKRIERVESDVRAIQVKLDRIETTVNEIKIAVTKGK